MARPTSNRSTNDMERRECRVATPMSQYGLQNNSKEVSQNVSFIFSSALLLTINSHLIPQPKPHNPSVTPYFTIMAVDAEPQTRRRADSRRGNDQADWVWKAPRPDFVRGANEAEDAWHARVNSDAQRLMKAYDVHHEPEGGEKETQRRVRVQREYDLSLLLGDRLQGYYKENSSKLGNTDAARDTLQALCDKFAKVQEDRQKQDLRSRKDDKQKQDPRSRKTAEPRQPVDKTLSSLKALQERADHGEFYARGTSDQLAQAWVDSDHKTTKYTPSNRRAEEVTRAELISMENAEAKRATGLTIQVVLDDFKRCAEIIKQLGDSISEEVEAEEAYDAYEDVSIANVHATAELMADYLRLLPNTGASFAASQTASAKLVSRSTLDLFTSHFSSST